MQEVCALQINSVSPFRRLCDQQVHQCRLIVSFQTRRPSYQRLCQHLTCTRVSPKSHIQLPDPETNKRNSRYTQLLKTEVSLWCTIWFLLCLLDSSRVPPRLLKAVHFFRWSLSSLPPPVNPPDLLTALTHPRFPVQDHILSAGGLRCSLVQGTPKNCSSCWTPVTCFFSSAAFGSHGRPRVQQVQRPLAIADEKASSVETRPALVPVDGFREALHYQTVILVLFQWKLEHHVRDHGIGVHPP